MFAVVLEEAADRIDGKKFNLCRLIVNLRKPSLFRSALITLVGVLR